VGEVIRKEEYGRMFDKPVPDIQVQESSRYIWERLTDAYAIQYFTIV